MASLSIAAVDTMAVIPPYMSDEILHYYESSEKEEGKGIALSLSPAESLSRKQAASNAFARAARGKRLEDSSEHEFSANLRDENSEPSPREVWDASLPSARLVLPPKPGSPVADAQARTCYMNMGAVDTFFKKTRNRYPVDNASKLMRAYVHYPKAFNNACWISGRESIFFGDVDPKIFNPLVDNLGVTTHEFGHAVTHFSGQLRYRGQSGALNESISDVFTIAAKHYFANVAADSPDADWLIGENLIVNSPTNGTALRSMSHPGTAYKNHPILKSDPQVGHMRDYHYTHEDNGGVHLNSGIPNHAFYLAASKMGGFSWHTATAIWYIALLDTEDDDFSSFAQKTLQATKDLNCKAPIYDIVGRAWRDVGVDLRGLRDEGKKSLPNTQQGVIQNPYVKQLNEDRDKFLIGISILGIAYAISKVASWMKKP